MLKLRELTTKVTTTLSGDVVSGSGSQDKIGDAIAKIVDTERAINRDIDTLVELREALSKKVDMLQDPNHIAVLHQHYFEFKSLEQIAADMGYTYRNVCYIHGKALQKFGTLLEGEQS